MNSGVSEKDNPSICKLVKFVVKFPEQLKEYLIMTTTNKKSARTAGIIISACLLYMASAGLRTVFGVLLNVIAAGTGIAYASVSSAIAIA